MSAVIANTAAGYLFPADCSSGAVDARVSLGFPTEECYKWTFQKRGLTDSGYLLNTFSQKRLDASGVTRGSLVVLRESSDSRTQMWTAVKVRNDSNGVPLYRVENEGSSWAIAGRLCLTGTVSPEFKDAPVTLERCDSNVSNQLWYSDEFR
jgi:hypothetical protein